MKFLSLFLLFTCLNLWASSTSIYKIGDKEYTFLEIPQENLTIEISCRKKGKLNCQAYNSLSHLNFENISPDVFDGGPDPGAVLCLHKVKGKVFEGKGTKGANCFCQFEDKSIIECASMHFYANKNSGVYR